MQNSEKHIDQIFRDGLQNYQVIPPTDVWNSVKTGIPKAREPFLWTKVAAVALILILAGTSWFVLFREKSNTGSDQEKLVQKTREESSPFRKKTRISPAHKTPANPVIVKNAVPPSGSSQKSEIKLNQPDFLAAGATKSQARKNEYLTYLPLKGVSLALYLYNPIAPSLIIRPPKKFNNIPALASLSLHPSYIQNDLNLSASEQYDQGAKNSKWGIAGNLSPVFSFRTINSNSTSNKDMNFFYDRESAMISYSGGVNAIYKKGKRLSFQTGIQYFRGGQILNDIIFYRNLQTGALLKREIYNQNIPYPFESSLGQVTSANLNPIMADFLLPDGSNYTGDRSARPEFENYEPVNTSVGQEFGFIEFPMFLRYRVIDRKIGLNIISGMGTSFLVDNNAYIQYEGQKVSLGKSQG